MTFQEKLDNSRIVKTGKIYYKHMNFPTSKQRVKSLIVFFLVALYTIYTKVVLKNYSFDLLVLANIVSIISMLYIKITTKTIFALNHYKQYSIVNFINKVSKVVIFIYAMMLYYEALNNGCIELFNKKISDLLLILIEETYLSREYLKALFFYMPIECISFCFTVIVFIPTFLYFVAFNLIIILRVIGWFIPIVNVILLFKWLFKTKYIFYEYGKESEKFYTVNKREITNKAYVFKLFLLKVLLVTIICLSVYYFKDILAFFN